MTIWWLWDHCLTTKYIVPENSVITLWLPPIQVDISVNKKRSRKQQQFQEAATAACMQPKKMRFHKEIGLILQFMARVICCPYCMYWWLAGLPPFALFSSWLSLYISSSQEITFMWANHVTAHSTVLQSLGHIYHNHLRLTIPRKECNNTRYLQILFSFLKYAFGQI